MNKYVEELLKMDKVKKLCDEYRIDEHDLEYLVSTARDIDPDITITGLDYLIYKINCLVILLELSKWFNKYYPDIKLEDGSKAYCPSLTIDRRYSYLGYGILLIFNTSYSIEILPCSFGNYRDDFSDLTSFEVPISVDISSGRTGELDSDTCGNNIPLEDITPQYILDGVNRLHKQGI